MMMSKGWRCVDVCCIHPKILRDTIKIMRHRRSSSIEHFFNPYLKSWPKLPLIGTLEQHEEGWDRLGAVKAIVRQCRIHGFSGFLISWRLNCVTINMACHGCIMQSHMTLQIAVRINSGHHRPASIMHVDTGFQEIVDSLFVVCFRKKRLSTGQRNSHGCGWARDLLCAEKHVKKKLSHSWNLKSSQTAFVILRCSWRPYSEELPRSSSSSSFTGGVAAVISKVKRKSLGHWDCL